ncbi:hypothetical protein P9851_09860 [Geobacillus stearothermophilus]|uniref:hypothetical protein n=1 Tax=Geobacillus stearothermophilus TaxID=1422 RepID=UPI002E2079D0|nr:hypothetical protein [Geobacillus stearothermophilus]
MERWKQWAKRIKKEIFVLYSACRDRRVPVWLRQGIGAFPVGGNRFRYGCLNLNIHFALTLVSFGLQ